MEPLTYQSSLIPPIQANKTGCFTTLPIRIHPRNDLADAATHRFIREWAKHVGDGREKKTHFSFSSVGNWSALIYPEAIPERLGVLAYLSDLGLIHDDTGEELAIDEAQAEHDDLHAALNPDDGRSLSEDSKALKTKKLVSQCMLECINLDHDLGLKMLAAFRDLWLAICEKDSGKEAQTIEEYFKQHSDNSGMLVFWPMLQFSLGMHISDSEQQLVQPIFNAATEGLLLANDYFSWEREYRELQAGKSQRIVNAVELLIRVRGLSIEDAKHAVKLMIVKAESDFCQRRDDLYQLHPDISVKLRRWIDCAGLAISGNHYWCSACPRQNAWRDEESGINRLKRGRECSIDGASPVNERYPDKKPRKLAKGSFNDGLTNGVKHNTTQVRKTQRNGVQEHGDASNGSCQEPESNGFTAQKKARALTDYSCPKPSSLAMEAPSTYISSMPSKGVRRALIDALNTWLCVPAGPLSTITSIVNTLHNASLILDDIEDNSPLRRGKPAAHTIFGQAQAINSANFMFVRATQMVTQDLNAAAMTAFLQELEGLYLGQSWDLYWKHNLTCPTEDEYINMVDYKTGGMFRMLVRLMEAESSSSSSSSSAPATRSKSLLKPDFRRLTLLFGRFFQIRDDYMNFGDYAAQKGFCEDLDEGKFSFPIVYCLQNSPDYRGHILGVFRQRPTIATSTGYPLPKESKEHLMSCLQRSGAFEKTMNCLQEVETELENEIGRLERELGESNPMLRLCLASLSVKGIRRLEKVNGSK